MTANKGERCVLAAGASSKASMSIASPTKAAPKLTGRQEKCAVRAAPRLAVTCTCRLFMAHVSRQVRVFVIAANCEASSSH